ncbi:MAG: general secretion pathway protein GspK [Pseudomonadota bacterium]
MIRIIQTDKGAALVITIAIVAVLLTAGLQLGHFARNSIKATRVEKDMFQAEQIAMSGIELAKLILADDAATNQIDSIQESWADPEKISAAIESLGIGTDVLKLTIIDELSKIQVNALINEFPGNTLNLDQVKIWEKLSNLEPFNKMVTDSGDPARIINPVKDWLDSNDDEMISGLSGAESDYYLNLDPPYECANGSLDHISQLSLIKGFSSDQLEKYRLDQSDDNQGQKIEWDHLFTVYGLSDEISGEKYRYPGRININTAPVEVIKALLPEDRQDLAETLVEFREQKSENNETFIHPLEKGWVENIIKLEAKEKKDFDQVIGYSSHFFKVVCRVSHHDTQGQWTAYLKREKNNLSGKWTCRVLQVERQ